MAAGLLQAHLWSYEGALDAHGVLTLDADGPVGGDPARTARYRLLLEATSARTRVMRSQIVGPDGEWFEFAQAEYRRTD